MRLRLLGTVWTVALAAAALVPAGAVAAAPGAVGEAAVPAGPASSSPGTGEGARRAGEGPGLDQNTDAAQPPRPAFGHLLSKGAGEAPRRAPPVRIVSLNVCTDQILLDLVAPQRIAGLSWLATDATLSAIANRAAAFPGVRDDAEVVLSLDPDLVIAQEYSATATVSMLRRLGRKVLMVPLATDFESTRKAVRAIAGAVGERARGEEIVRGFDARLAAIVPPAGKRPTAIAYEVNSLTSGPRTLLDAAMTAAGFDNLARRETLDAGGRLPLESLVADPPDLLILANTPDEFRTVTADNLRHPALRRILATRPSVHIPMTQWLCGTPEVAGAVESLAAVRAALPGRALAHSMAGPQPPAGAHRSPPVGTAAPRSPPGAAREMGPP